MARNNSLAKQYNIIVWMANCCRTLSLSENGVETDRCCNFSIRGNLSKLHPPPPQHPVCWVTELLNQTIFFSCFIYSSFIRSFICIQTHMLENDPIYKWYTVFFFQCWFYWNSLNHLKFITYLYVQWFWIFS